MKRIYLLLIILMIVQLPFLKSQILVDFKFDNYCDTPIDRFIVGVNNLTDNEFKEYSFRGDTGSVIIPHDKYVFCSIYYFRKNISFQTEFPDFPFVTDLNKKTIILPAYKLNIGDTSFWDAKYYYCDKVCSGRIIDYYKNGNIRIEGKFKDGNSRKIKYYDKHGNLLKINKYNRHGYRIKTIDKMIN